MTPVAAVFVRRCFALGLLVVGMRASELAGPGAHRDPADEIAALRREIARHDELYHRRAAPEIGDFDYDQLKRRLRELEKTFPALAPEVPSPAEVADDRSGFFPTYRHRERMLSLEKAYTPSELRAFHARLAKLLGRAALDYAIEPKFDGIAVSVTYENGRLVRAVTRGNGTEGDDITANARTIAGLPAHLRVNGTAEPPEAVPELIEVRGEIYVPLAEFARINAEREAADEPAFAHPRTLVAGAIRQQDPAAVADRALRVVFYGVGACDPESALPARQRDFPATFARWGLPSLEKHWFARGGEELVAAIAAVQRARREFDFPTDGAVVKLDALALQRTLGVGESVPRWAVAYKFPTERVETQVRAITLQVGRTGVLTPVAELVPVELAGSTIARATLHNRDEIARKDIREGDFVFVEKAGEIIPAVVGVNRARRPVASAPFAFPLGCPGCGKPVAASASEAAVRCVNVDCPAQLRRRLEHFASSGSVNIAGLGPATIDLLVKTKLVTSLPDLYRLQRADLVGRAGLSEKSAAQLLRAIETSKRAELWRVIHGLGIPKVGAVNARELAERCATLENLPDLAADHVAGRAVAAFFADARHRALVAELAQLGVRPEARTRTVGRYVFAQQVFVLTGTLPTLTREQAKRRIEAAGGRVVENVTRATTCVVAGRDAGAKLEQAQRLGIAVIDEAALLERLAPE